MDIIRKTIMALLITFSFMAESFSASFGAFNGISKGIGISPTFYITPDPPSLDL